MSDTVEQPAGGHCLRMQSGCRVVGRLMAASLNKHHPSGASMSPLPVSAHRVSASRIRSAVWRSTRRSSARALEAQDILVRDAASVGEGCFSSGVPLTMEFLFPVVKIARHNRFAS
jgi:hypothetical protein